MKDWLRLLRRPVDAERSEQLERETEAMVAESRAAIKRAEAAIASYRRADRAIRQYRAGL